MVEIGDIVEVSFHGSQFTLCVGAVVKHIPRATGDSWIFEDAKNGKIHYVSEGCTVTKVRAKDDG